MRQCERCQQGKVVQVIALPNGDDALALCAICLETTYLVRFLIVPPNDCPSCGRAVDDHPTVQGCRRWS